MAWSRRRLAIWVCVLGTATLAVGTATTAFAGKGLKTRSVTTTTVDDVGQLVATAECKQGERVVSGGFSSQDDSYATESRAAQGQKWIVRLWGSGQPDESLTVDAYCAKEGRFSKHKKTEDAVETTDPTKSKAKCGKKEAAVAGGYTLVTDDGGGNSPVFIARKARKRAWSVSAFADDPPGSLTTFVYCRKGAKVKVRSAQSDPIDDEEPGSATAKCHRGETLLSGGYTTTPESDFNNTTGPDFFYYVSSRSGPRSWTAAAHNYSDVAGQITTFAYCQKKK
jgi:hypothetical protein